MYAKLSLTIPGSFGIFGMMLAVAFGGAHEMQVLGFCLGVVLGTGIIQR